MSEFSTSFFKWFSERPKCLQIAVTRFLEKAAHSDKIVLDLMSLCQQEAEGNKSGPVMK